MDGRKKQKEKERVKQDLQQAITLLQLPETIQHRLMLKNDVGYTEKNQSNLRLTAIISDKDREIESLKL